MGDRCYLQVTLRKGDVRRFGQAFSPGWCRGDEENCWWDDEIAGNPEPESDDDNGPVTLAVNDINYGGDEEVLAAANLGLTFYGLHDAGCEYGGQMFASVKGCCLWHDTCFDGGLYVPVDSDTGKINKQALTEARIFVRHLRAAKRIIEKGHKQV